MGTRQKLSAKAAEHAKPGKHSDGNGLSLVVKASGARSWVARYIDADGKRRDKGLGGWPQVTLAEARRLTVSLQAQAANGTTVTVKAEAPVPTFRKTAEAVHAQLLPTWRDIKASRQWWARLENHTKPLLTKRVTDIEHTDVLAVLLPIWAAKPSTARRLRQDIRRIMAYAMAFDKRIATNPAGESIDGALIAQPRTRNHRRAIPFSDVPQALDIVDRSGAYETARLCFRFLTLTAVRSIEAREASWGEIDFDTAVWSIPGERMKAGRPHRVPLSRQALDVLQAAKVHADDSGLIFPSPYGKGRPLTCEGLQRLLRSNMIDATPHGFRASFRQWALEQPGTSWAACELSLAHSLGNGAVVAYTRDADLLEERRTLMQAWADFATAVVR